LVSQPLKLLYLGLEVELELLFLGLVGRRLHLLVYILEELDAFGDFLQGSVDFGWDKGETRGRREAQGAYFGAFWQPWLGKGGRVVSREAEEENGMCLFDEY
jgi:hypothetical protein